MIKVVCGDITKLEVDAIVNAANSALVDGSGVNGAIHKVAGHELSEACQRIRGGCPAGEARITPGFRLPARFVIHTVGPVWRGGSHGEAELLAKCYHESFKLALDYDVQSIAFSSISTGVFGYPKDKAAEIAVREMRTFENHFAQIVACCFSREDEKRYLTLLNRVDSPPE